VDNERIVLAYVGAVGRSGTTLIDRMVGQLPGAISVGEVVHLWYRGVLENQRCGCGAHFADCPFWQAVGEQAYGGWSRGHAERVLSLKAAVDRTRHVPRMARPTGRFAVDLQDLRAELQPLYAAVRSVSGARVVVDSSKHASYAYVLRGMPETDLRLIHVVRAVEGVVHSSRKVVSRPETDGAEEMPRYSAQRVSVRWVAQNLLLDRLRKTGCSGRLVRYEDAMADPQAMMQTLGSLLDLDGDDVSYLSDHTVTLRPAHTVAGNPMRFTTGEVTLRQDDGWRTGLPTAPRVVARSITAPVAGRFGYPPTRALRASVER